MEGLKHFWISWIQPGDDCRPLTDPPNEAIFGWWNTGTITSWVNKKSSTLCALVAGVDEAAAESAVRKDWPEVVSWRFCNMVETDWVPGDRFPITRDWERERLAARNQTAKETTVKDLMEMISNFIQSDRRSGQIFDAGLQLKQMRVTDRYRNDLEAALTTLVGAIYDAKHLAGLVSGDLAAAKEDHEAAIHAIVSTIGGVDYEGLPTSEINYIQRLRILVEAEKDLAKTSDELRRLKDTVTSMEKSYLAEHEHWGECKFRFALADLRQKLMHKSDDLSEIIDGMANRTMRYPIDVLKGHLEGFDRIIKAIPTGGKS